MSEKEYKFEVRIYTEGDGYYLAESNFEGSGHNSMSWESKENVLETAQGLLEELFERHLP